MADPKAVEFLEDVYARVDKQVRDIVTSMLPGVTIAAQDDGAVVANNHRILNFQGPGVAVSDEPAKRRVNVFVPGAPVSSATTTVVSSTSAKVLNLWTGSANNAPPANWQTVGFNDSAWSAAVAANRGTGMGAPTGATAIWTTASPASSTQEILTRQTFTLPSGSVTSATLTLSADDQINAIYVNGTLVDFSGPPGYGPPSYSTTTLEVPVALLSAGSNLLAVWAKNFDPSAVGTSTLSWNYTITGSEVVGTPFLSVAVSAFTGAFTISLHASAGTAGTNLAYRFTHSSAPSSKCYSAYWTLLSGATDATHTNTVGVPTSSWTCYDWDTLQVYYPTGTTGHLFSVGTVLTVTLTSSTAPAGANAWVGYRLDVGTSDAGTDTRYQLLAQKGQPNGYASLDATGLVPTSQLPAGGGGTSDLVKVTETIVSTPVASVTLAPPASGYTHLRLIYLARGTASAASVSFTLQFNGDTATHYFWQNALGNSTAASGNQGLAQASMTVANIPAATALAGTVGAGSFDIPYYQQTTFGHAVTGTAGYFQNNTSGSGIAFTVFGFWNQTAAITSITVLPATPNLATGSIFSLYAYR